MNLLALALLFGQVTEAYKLPERMAPFPESRVIKNYGSSKDGKGLEVFICFEHSATWAGWKEFKGFTEWISMRYPGGCSPEKLDEVVKRYCKYFDIEVPLYRQYEGDKLDWAKAALRRGELPAITLYSGTQYGDKGVAHVVNLTYFGDKTIGYIDCNFPTSTFWCPVEDWKKRFYQDDYFWAFSIGKRW